MGTYGAGFSRLNLYLLLGDKLPGDWQEGYRSEAREHGLARATNRACVRYHCPKWLAKWAFGRRADQEFGCRLDLAWHYG